MLKKVTVASLLLSCLASALAASAPSPEALKAARHAVSAYSKEIEASLGRMTSFNTVADPAVPFETNPQNIGFKRYIKDQAARLGLDYTDYGYVMVVGLGRGTERVGIITHGDVQPADPAKWKKSPYQMDTKSEPGRLIGRGTEDDKGPIATAMYAMKAIKDQHVPLSKRLELYIYMAEESNWDKLEEFLKSHVPPQMNITLDSQYPAVTAEKGYGTVSVTVPASAAAPAADQVTLASFGGGFFGSQIPEDASAAIANATPALEAAIRERAGKQSAMHYQYQWQDHTLKITARGVSAHSSAPENGVNAISMLADALNIERWPDTAAGGVVNFLNDLIGTGLYGEKFGKIAYRDDFMGSMTFVPTVIRQQQDGIEININVRRPQGKSEQQLKGDIIAALDAWQHQHGALAGIKVQLTDPWVQKNAPQVPILLSVFSHFTGIQDVKPVSIGGGTNSRMFPSAVSFGPAMPGAVYTGHSEHEFITRKQLLLNLQMYTAVLVELAR